MGSLSSKKTFVNVLASLTILTLVAHLDSCHSVKMSDWEVQAGQSKVRKELQEETDKALDTMESISKWMEDNLARAKDIRRLIIDNTEQIEYLVEHLDQNTHTTTTELNFQQGDANCTDILPGTFYTQYPSKLPDLVEVGAMDVGFVYYVSPSILRHQVGWNFLSRDDFVAVSKTGGYVLPIMMCPSREAILMIRDNAAYTSEILGADSDKDVKLVIRCE